jgi:DNA-binding winged helix-turn-helix (wHTH) protein
MRKTGLAGVIILFPGPDRGPLGEDVVRTVAESCAWRLHGVLLAEGIAQVTADVELLAVLASQLHVPLVVFGDEPRPIFANEPGRQLLRVLGRHHDSCWMDGLYEAISAAGRTESWQFIRVDEDLPDLLLVSLVNGMSLLIDCGGPSGRALVRRDDFDVAEAAIMLQQLAGVLLARPASIATPATEAELSVARLAPSPQPYSHVPRVLRVGSIEIDTVDQTVCVDGDRVVLTPSELRLLTLLARSPNQVVSRQQILEHLFGPDTVLPGDSCYTHVWRLRRKIERESPNSARIMCVRGQGYKLIALSGAARHDVHEFRAASAFPAAGLEHGS